MSKYFRNKELLNTSFEKYAKAVNQVKACLSKHLDYTKNLPIDHRDLAATFMLLQNGNAEFTDDEIENKLGDLVIDLKNNTQKVFDKIYDIYENFSLDKFDCNNEKDIIKTFSYAQANQSFSTNLVMNPEYKLNRYGQTLEAQMYADSLNMNSVSMNQEIQNDLYENLISITSVSKMPGRMPNPSDFDPEWSKEMDKTIRNFSNSYREWLSGEEDFVTLEITDSWTYLDNPANQEEEDYRNKKGIYEKQISSLLAQIKNKGSFSSFVAEGLKDNSFLSSIYIDGKCLLNLANSKDVEAQSIKATKLFKEAIVKGKPIDICQSRVVNGKPELSICPLNLDFKDRVTEDLTEANYQSHSWVRRTFFDWGPFKIKDIDYERRNQINVSTVNDRVQKIQNEFNKNLASKVVDGYNKYLDQRAKEADSTNPNRLKDYTNEADHENIREQITIDINSYGKNEKEFVFEDDNELEKSISNDIIYNEKDDNVREP